MRVERRKLSIGYSRQRRNERRKGAGVAPHRECLARQLHLVHRLFDFLLDTLRRQSRQLGRALDDGVPGVALDVEPEARSKSYRAQRAQPVLAHPLARIADGANELSIQILLAAVRIAHFILARRISDGVDGVVAAGEIFVEGSAELDDRVPPIGLNVTAKSRDLVHHVVMIEDTDGPELDPDRNGALEQLPNLRRLRGRRQIPVEVRMAEQRVANRAADAPGLEARVFQPLRDSASGLWWIEFGRHESNIDLNSGSRIPAPRASIKSIRACWARRDPPKMAPISSRRRPPPG
jgi:hypothetical protein